MTAPRATIRIDHGYISDINLDNSKNTQAETASKIVDKGVLGGLADRSSANVGPQKKRRNPAFDCPLSRESVRRSKNSQASSGRRAMATLQSRRKSSCRRPFRS